MKMKMMSSEARGIKLGRCSKRKKNNDDEEDLKLLPLNKKTVTIMCRGLRRLGTNCLQGNQQLKRKTKPLEDKKKKKKKKKLPTVQKGDVVNLSDLLFTKDRDYLIKGHNNQRVEAKQLAGKVIVLHFMDLVPWADNWMRETKRLVDIYNELQPKGCLEVVFIAITDTTACSKGEVYSTPEEQRFEERYSVMPWPAIPFSDLKSRKHLEKQFGGISRFRGRAHPAFFVINPAGVVLQSLGDYYFSKYGALGYPFSDEKINILISEDHAVREHPSITSLLASPERNYVISNTGDQVAVSDLEDKVVALYFYEESPMDDFVPKLQMAYEDLTRNEEKFEIVLIYVHDTLGTYDCTTEVSFRKRFSTMPWLALPFKDPNCKKLQRIFDYPDMLEEPGPDPTLVIIGPHGKFIELFGADILLNFGIAAYPFTRESAGKLVAEKAKRLKLEMLWRDPNTLFRQKYGPDVRFSQLAGKRTILIFGDDWLNLYVDFFRMLKARYLEMKGTIDEFEVIHISHNVQGSPYNEHVAATPWLTHPAFAYESNERKLVHSVCHFGWGLLAFDSDGRLIRRTICPSFEKKDMDFPFHAGSLEKDAVFELVKRFDWWDLSSDDDDDDDDVGPSNN